MLPLGMQDRLTHWENGVSLADEAANCLCTFKSGHQPISPPAIPTPFHHRLKATSSMASTAASTRARQGSGTASGRLPPRWDNARPPPPTHTRNTCYIFAYRYCGKASYARRRP